VTKCYQCLQSSNRPGRLGPTATIGILVDTRAYDSYGENFHSMDVEAVSTVMEVKREERQRPFCIIVRHSNYLRESYEPVIMPFSLSLIPLAQTSAIAWSSQPSLSQVTMGQDADLKEKPSEAL
jgi:hypothetical protein